MDIKVLSADMAQLENVVPILETIHKSGIFSNYGPVESTYREALGELLNVAPEKISTCANATVGIQGITQIVNQKSWRVQNWTFPATGLAVQNSKNKFSFVDVSLRSWTVDHQSAGTLEEGLISTIPFGASLGETFIKRHGFHIIDAAASLGNLDDLSFLGKNVVIVFSLHATKILGCGEGGLVICGDEDLAKEFRSWANFGFSGSRDSSIYGSSNGKLSEISCAYALANLREFPEKKDRYLRMRKKVNAISRDVGILPKVMDHDDISPYWIVKFESNQDRNLVEKKLSHSGIETRRWWPKPLSDMPAFQSGQNEPLSDTNSRYLANTTLGLPFHLKLSESEIEYIGFKLAEGFN